MTQVSAGACMLALRDLGANASPPMTPFGCGFSIGSGHARPFSSDTNSPLRCWRACDKHDQYRRAVVKAFAAAGGLGIHLPEVFGGMNLGVRGASAAQPWNSPVAMPASAWHSIAPSA